jgi:hypothetical protein
MIGSFNPKSPNFLPAAATPKLKTFTGWYASLYACVCRYPVELNQQTLSHHHITIFFGVYLVFFFSLSHRSWSHRSHFCHGMLWQIYIRSPDLCPFHFKPKWGPIETRWSVTTFVNLCLLDCLIWWP